MSLTTVNHSIDEAWEKLLKKKELRKIKNINIETQIRNLIKNQNQKWIKSTFWKKRYLH